MCAHVRVVQSVDGARQLVVTLTKAEPTKGNQHWNSAIKGEGVIDTSTFGPAIITVDPNDPESLQAALSGMNK